MSEITLSLGELNFLKETFELVLEEFEGIEEARDSGDLDDYVLTTGALENSRIAYDLIEAWKTTIRNEELVKEEEAIGC